MFTILITIEVLIAVFLIVVVLMQASKGGGLAGTFGGSSMGATFGLRRTADFLIRATQLLGFTFIVLALIINMFFLPRTQDIQSILQESSTQQPLPSTPQVPPAQLPLDEQIPALPE